MRGRTNISGSVGSGGDGNINGIVKEYEVYEGNAIKSGDFVSAKNESKFYIVSSICDEPVEIVKVNDTDFLLACTKESAYAIMLYYIRIKNNVPIVLWEKDTRFQNSKGYNNGQSFILIYKNGRGYLLGCNTTLSSGSYHYFHYMSLEISDSGVICGEDTVTAFDGGTSIRNMCACFINDDYIYLTYDNEARICKILPNGQLDESGELMQNFPSGYAVPISDTRIFVDGKLLSLNLQEKTASVINSVGLNSGRHFVLNGKIISIRSGSQYSYDKKNTVINGIVIKGDDLLTIPELTYGQEHSYSTIVSMFPLQNDNILVRTPHEDTIIKVGERFEIVSMSEYNGRNETYSNTQLTNNSGVCYKYLLQNENYQPIDEIHVAFYKIVGNEVIFSEDKTYVTQCNGIIKGVAKTSGSAGNIIEVVVPNET